MRFAPTIGAALATLLATPPSWAASPLDGMVAGAGRVATDCWVVLRGLAADGRHVTCHDGDPACDADGAADGRCALRLQVCVDAPLAGCTPTTVDRLIVAPPDLGLPLPGLPASQETCADPGLVTVSLRRGGVKPGTRKIVLVARSGESSRRDKDRIAITCVPGEPSAVTTTTSSLASTTSTSTSTTTSSMPVASTTTTSTTTTTSGATDQCCLRTETCGAFDSCQTMTATDCAVAGGFDVGPGDCGGPAPCAAATTTTPPSACCVGDQCTFTGLCQCYSILHGEFRLFQSCTPDPCVPTTTTIF